MKNYIIILCFIVLTGCAKKVHITDSFDSTTKIKTSGDTSTRKSLLVTDKTKTFTTRYIDTSVTVTGGILNGYLSPSMLKADTSAYFENQDLSVQLDIDKSGYAYFVAKSKPKKVPVEMLELREAYNDITTKQDLQVNSKTAIDVKTTLSQKHSEKQTMPSTSPWFNVVLAITMAIAFIWLIRKLNLLKVL